MSRSVDQRVRQVLRGLHFPAEKWQIVTQAEIYGADARTRDQLYQLPMREYRSWSEVAELVASNNQAPAGRTREESTRG